MNIINKAFYSGTSGLALPVPKTLYPPAYQGKSRLDYYASLFNSLEVNSSFYKMPMSSTVDKWAAAVPAEFRFTFKLSKAITHTKGLAFSKKDIYDFMQVIAHAGNKKGCLLVQFPPSLKIEKINQLRKLLTAIQKANAEDGWKVAVEFRHISWYQQHVYDLLDQYNTAMVIHDLPASVTPLITLEANFVYLRFHGPGGRYRGTYSDDFLYTHAQHIKDWMNQKKTVYAYFNNTMGDAAKNLTTLNSFV
jgi:uncharacterized protein YecE (DUF72 family)